MYHFPLFLIYSLSLLLITSCQPVEKDKQNATEATPVTWPYERSTSYLASGRAVKGVIKYAKITAIGWIEGQPVLLDQTTTDQTGLYNLNIPSQYSGPIEIQLQSEKDKTIAICDYPEGCGKTASKEYDFNQNDQIDFGEDYKTAENFQLSALWEGTEASHQSAPPSFSVTPISTLASAAIKAQSNPPNAQTIIAENKKIADTLGLTQSLTQIQPYDLTSFDIQIENEINALNLSLINAAFLGFTQNEKSAELIQQTAKKYAIEKSQTGSKTKELILSELAGQGSYIAQYLNLKQSAAMLLRKKNEALEDNNSSKSMIYDESHQLYTQEEIEKLAENNLIKTSYNSTLLFLDFFVVSADSWNWLMQWMLIPLIPEFAQSSLCPMLQAPYSALCQNLGLIENFDILCATLGITIQGTSDLCSLFESITFINTKDLTVKYSLKDKLLTINGKENNTLFDFSILSAKNNLGKISLTLSGTMEINSFSINLSNSTWTLKVPTDLLDKKQLVGITAQTDFILKNTATDESIKGSSLFSIPVNLDFASLISNNQNSAIGQLQYVVSGNASSSVAETLPFTIISSDNSFYFGAF